MIKIDFKEFITDRVWFGWWYRDFKFDDTLPKPLDAGWLSRSYVMGRYYSKKWVRDPNPRCHWKIKKLKNPGVPYYDD